METLGELLVIRYYPSFTQKLLTIKDAAGFLTVAECNKMILKHLEQFCNQSNILQKDRNQPRDATKQDRRTVERWKMGAILVPG